MLVHVVMFFLDVPLSKNVDALIMSEYRFGDHSSDLYTKINQINVNWRVKPWLVISPGYRNFETRLFRGNLNHWTTLPTPMIDVILKKQLRNAKHFSP